MIASFLTHLIAFIAGSVATSVVMNNQHRKIPRKIIEEVDDLIDGAEDTVKSKWKQIREKF